MEGSHFKLILHQEAFFAENKAICKQTRCSGGGGTTLPVLLTHME